MIPRLRLTAWWLNRSNWIVFAHFVEANSTWVIWCMHDWWSFDTMMFMAIRTIPTEKFEATILVQSTWKMKWSFAWLYNASNVCTRLPAVGTFLCKWMMFLHSNRISQSASHFMRVFRIIPHNSTMYLLTNFWARLRSFIISRARNPLIPSSSLPCCAQPELRSYNV